MAAPDINGLIDKLSGPQRECLAGIEADVTGRATTIAVLRRMDLLKEEEGRFKRSAPRTPLGRKVTKKLREMGYG